MKKGMTLLEVLIAMFLLTLVASGVVAIFSLFGQKPSQTEVVEAQALNYARETLEKLKNSVSDNALEAAPLSAGLNKPDPLPGGKFRDKRGGNRKYDVTDVSDGGDLNYKRVTVTVTWND